MPGAPAKLTQADVARALRAAKAEGMTVHISADAVMTIVPMPVAAAPARTARILYYERMEEVAAHNEELLRAARNMVRVVYFVGTDRLVKIGFATDFASRFAGLSVASPEPLQIHGIIDGGPETEKTLHAKWAELRMRGEWFWLTASLRDFIKGVSKV